MWCASWWRGLPGGGLLRNAVASGPPEPGQVINDLPGAEVRFGDVTDPASLAAEAFNQPTDVVVSCLASRTGGRIPGRSITRPPSTPIGGRGLAPCVLLQRLRAETAAEFRGQLAFEAELRADGEMTHSIVRPTAFFQSLGGQVESCRKGGPYVMEVTGELQADQRGRPGTSWPIACGMRTNETRCCRSGAGPGPRARSRRCCSELSGNLHGSVTAAGPDGRTDQPA